jgi:hypothetical protein
MEKSPKRSTIILVSIVLSIILYLAGVMSGLYANKIIDKKTTEDINTLKTETQKNIQDVRAEAKENIESLQRYINFLELNLKSIQFDQIFLETLDETQKCNFSSITMNSLLTQLDAYRVNLPFRLEEYEKGNTLSVEYLELKKQYNELSINAWIILKNKYHICDTEILPILYFYSRDCDSCIRQGEELDKLQQDTSLTKRFMVFTIDYTSEQPMVKNVREFYRIKSLPALVIDNAVLQGRVFAKERILSEVE